MALKKTFDVLGLGSVAVDDLIYVEEYPPPDEKARVLERRRKCGGLTAIALVAAARLGARCAYAGVLGKDELSRYLLDCLKKEKIDVSWTRQTASARPIHSNIVVDLHRGTRNIFFDVDGFVGANPSVSAGLVASSRVLFVDNFGLPAMIRAARLARRASVPVVADFENHREKQFSDLLGLTDHLIISRRFAEKLTGQSLPVKALGTLAASSHEVVVITDGANGCWYWSRETAQPRHRSAFKINAMDTTGCGDVFHGAYAFALARQMPLEERLVIASAAAALKASGNGEPTAIPTLAKVRRFLSHELPRPSA